MMYGMVMVPIIIGFYMFIGSALLVFNVWYIARHRGDDRRHWRKTGKWLREIKRQVRVASVVPGAHADEAHLKKLAEELQNVTELTAYDDALGRAAPFFPKWQLQAYLLGCMRSFNVLTEAYSKHGDMEKAYYVQGMTRHLSTLGVELIREEQLYPFLANSNVFCRENTLRLLCAMGDAGAVHRAFAILAEKGIFHHEALLTGVLMAFSGDKSTLAMRLWQEVMVWPPHMGVAVIRFIELIGADYRQAFYANIKAYGLSHDVRIAMLRYFGKHPFEPMQELLFAYLRDADNGGADLAAVSARVLGAYPGQESITAIKDALFSKSWEVRNNAAVSLMELKANELDLDEVLSGQDKFAFEMLCYHIQAQGQVARFPYCARKEAEK